MAGGKNGGLKRLRRLTLFGVIAGAAAWFAPIPTLILFICGSLDVGRHSRFRWPLVEEYFTSKGLVTWLLSPINLLADLASRGGTGLVRFEDMPEAHRQEIEACVAAFIDNGDAIRTHIQESLGATPRAMLTFQWFGRAAPTAIRIPAFERRYRYVKTIAVSTFSPRARTSWHFGPHRLTFRVLRNLDPIASREAYVAVDDQVHRWADDPLMVFDDTMIHQSVNNLDAARYCLFMDVIRPNNAQPLFDAAVAVLGLMAGPFKALFYRNWAFIR
ncbi:MAG TPA: aspartyl/asparaginyl beta-hydroxylase domain-containing protein [Caulobacteraceae bacterium]